MESEQVSSSLYPVFASNYASVCEAARLSAVMLVLGVTFVPWLRREMTRIVLGALWLLVAVGYYWETVGGWMGVTLGVLSCLEAILLLFNLEELLTRGKVTLHVTYFPLIIDLRTVNSAIGCFGAFTLLVPSTQVLPTLVSNPIIPLFPAPQVLAAFTFLLLSMSQPCTDDLTALLHALLVSRLPLLIFISEFLLSVSESGELSTDHLLTILLLTVGYVCRLHPYLPPNLPALPAAHRYREVLIESRPYGDGGTQGAALIHEYEDKEGSRGNEFYLETARHLAQVPVTELKSLA